MRGARRIAEIPAGNWTAWGAFVSVNGTSPETLPGWRAASQRYIEDFLRDVSWRPDLGLDISACACSCAKRRMYFW